MSGRRFKLDGLLAAVSKGVKLAEMHPIPKVGAGVARARERASPASPVSFTITGEPMGAPRQTRSDTWKPRPCVLRYRAWKDDARAAAPANLPLSPISVSIAAYLPIPDSWSAKKKTAMAGELHQSKPDWDNIAKGVCDALWNQDSCIAIGSTTKRWDDGKGARIEVTVY